MGINLHQSLATTLASSVMSLCHICGIWNSITSPYMKIRGILTALVALNNLTNFPSSLNISTKKIICKKEKLNVWNAGLRPVIGEILSSTKGEYMTEIDKISLVINVAKASC